MVQWNQKGHSAITSLDGLDLINPRDGQQVHKTLQHNNDDDHSRGDCGIAGAGDATGRPVQQRRRRQMLILAGDPGIRKHLLGF